MNEERIKEVFSDEAFVKALLEQEEAAQVQAMLAEKEIDLSIEEINKLQELLLKQSSGEVDEEELSEDALEDVAGGSLVVLGALIIATLGLGLVAGSAACLASNRRRRW